MTSRRLRELTHGRDCQKRSRSGLCSKPPDVRSLGDIALKPSLRKSYRDKVNIFYGIVYINSTCNLFLSMCIFIICVHCCHFRPKVGIVICRYERSKCISLQVHLFEISTRSYQIDVALSNGVGFQPIRIVVL